MDDLLRNAVDMVDDLFFVFTKEGEYLDWNESVQSVTGYTDTEMEQLAPTDLVVESDRDEVGAAMERVATARESVTIEATLLRKDGTTVPYEFSGAPIDDEGEVVAIAGIGRDITERRKHIEELDAMATELRELSMPVMEVWDSILLSTIVGRLDSDIAERFTEDLLERIVERQAEVAIIDISEVLVIDTQTAQHLIDTIRAVQLLGSEIIITGLKPELSQTFVRLGIGFQVETRATLGDGLQSALETKGVTIS